MRKEQDITGLKSRDAMHRVSVGGGLKARSGTFSGNGGTDSPVGEIFPPIRNMIREFDGTLLQFGVFSMNLMDFSSNSESDPRISEIFPPIRRIFYEKDRSFYEIDGLIHEFDRSFHEKDRSFHEFDGSFYEKDGSSHKLDGSFHEKDRSFHELYCARDSFVHEYIILSLRRHGTFSSVFLCVFSVELCVISLFLTQRDTEKKAPYIHAQNHTARSIDGTCSDIH
jgi:hypothetical protein